MHTVQKITSQVTNTRVKALISTLALAFVFTACTNKEKIIERQAPPEVQQSFAVQGANLSVKKSSLGKIFLLIASGKSGGLTPQWVDIKPQVVSFEKDASGKKLALLEENYDSVYSEIQSKQLLATFDILQEDSDKVVFAWGQGLQSFAFVNVFDSDVNDPNVKEDSTNGPGGADASKAVMPVIDSYVQSLQFDDANNLEINQISRLRINSLDVQKGTGFETREETLSMNLQIRPYSGPSREFSPKLADASRRVGFFVNKLHDKTLSKGVKNLILKWDLAPEKGPITFLVPTAVPAAYVQAVREGALYWNQVFGREVMVVQTGVDPQLTPKNRSILLHWISWMDSGAAYAQAQSDPLTGEILRAQIFMPSVFTRVGSASLVITNDGNPTQKKPTLNVTAACDVARKFLGVNQLAAEANDSQRLRLAQDSVRSTVAHEMGHTLGLRHNFAGSFSTKLSTTAIFAAAKNYLKEAQPEGLETTTSIMDYVQGVDDILSSVYIKKHALSYDKMAMDWAYTSGDAGLNEKVSKYCSDEDIALAGAKGLQIYGCERFDAGNNPLERKYLDAKTEKEILVKTLFTSVINRLYPADGSTKADIDKVIADTLPAWLVLSPSSYAYLSQALLATVVSETSVKSTTLSFEKAKATLSVDDGAGDLALDEKLAADLKSMGGYSGLLEGLLRNTAGQIDMGWAAQQLEALKKTPAFTSGKTLAGRPYDLVKEDHDKILGLFEKVVQLNQKSILGVVSGMLPRKNLVLKAGLLQAGEANKLALLFGDLLQASNGHIDALTGEGLQTPLALPKKYAELEDVAAYLSLIEPGALQLQDSDLDDNQKNRDTIKARLIAGINPVFIAADPEADLDDGELESPTVATYTALVRDLLGQNRLDMPTLQWLLRELSLLKVLSRRPKFVTRRSFSQAVLK